MNRTKLNTKKRKKRFYGKKSEILNKVNLQMGKIDVDQQTVGSYDQIIFPPFLMTIYFRNTEIFVIHFHSFLFSTPFHINKRLLAL